MAKVINAVFGGGLFATTAKVFQYDVGDKLRFIGVDLPAGYSVDFANSRTGASTTVLGNAGGVTIPPEYFIPGTEIYAWVVISDADGHYTRYQAKIPIYERASRTSVEPTPAQADALDDAINALNSAVEDVEDIADGIQDKINAALEEAKASGEFDGADGADGSSVWTVDVQYTRNTGGNIQAQRAHLVGPAGVTPRAGDLVVVSDGRFGSIVVVTSVAALVSPLGDLTGPQGYSPTVTVTEIEGGHQVTITDEDGDHVFYVMDGQNGGGTSDYDDLTDKPSINNVTLSGNKSAADLGLAPAGAYVKPSGGIPGSDLETAYAPEASVIGAVDELLDLIDRRYAKPSDGIPKTDLANAVQTSLDKADTALQVAQGVSHAGEFVVVGSDGNITTVTMAAWQGGSY